MIEVMLKRAKISDHIGCKKIEDGRICLHYDESMGDGDDNSKSY